MIDACTFLYWTKKYVGDSRGSIMTILMESHHFKNIRLITCSSKLFNIWKQYIPFEIFWNSNIKWLIFSLKFEWRITINANMVKLILFTFIIHCLTILNPFKISNCWKWMNWSLIKIDEAPTLNSFSL